VKLYTLLKEIVGKPKAIILAGAPGAPQNPKTPIFWKELL
jgi:hypothetical protein